MSAAVGSTMAFPALFGGYELLEEIGRGGMGVVYKARQVALNRTVALKLLLHGRFSDAAFLDRFHLEAEAAAHLDHPNIVPIYEVGVQEGQPYYSMRLIEGRSLEQLIAECRAQSAEQGRETAECGTRNGEWARRSAELVATIARAVHHAHRHGVLHRDIKPHNILLDTEGRPYLTDFGLAKLLNADTGLTVSVAVIGSPGFMAPEQAAGKTREITTAADIYGLGAVLYAMLTGKAVFHADTPLETVRLVIEQEPVRPRTLNPAVDRNLETICLKCLQKEPAKRYPSALALAEDLESWSRGEPIQARRVSEVERLWLWCRRKPALATAMGAVVLVALAGFVGILTQLQRAKANELFARRTAYAADMDSAQAALEKGDYGRAVFFLDAQRPAAGQRDLRGWEWRYLWQRCRSDERFRLCQYSNAISMLTYSPDGKWLAVRQRSGAVARNPDGRSSEHWLPARQNTGAVTVWDAVTRKPVAEWVPKGNATALAISSSPGWLAYGDEGTNGAPVVSLTNLTTHQEVRLPHSGEVLRLAFSPDGSLLGTLSLDGKVSLWQVASRQVIVSRIVSVTKEFGRIAFSPDGRLLAFGQGTVIQLWEWATGRERTLPLPAPGDSVSAMAFSSDARLLAASCGRLDNQIHLWDVADVWDLPARAAVPMVGELAGHRSWIADLAFAPNGKTLASASADQTVRLWEIAGMKELRRFQGHTHDVSAVTFSPDGKYIVSGGQDGSVRYWDPMEKPPAPSPTVLPIPVWSAAFAFSPDGKRFIALDNRDGSASLWDTAAVHLIEQLPFLGTNNSAVKWSPNGRMLAVGDWRGNLRVWDLAKRRVITKFANEGTHVGAIRFAGKGRSLWCGLVAHKNGERFVKVWNVGDWRELPLPAEATYRIKWNAVSPDNRTTATLDVHGTVIWWDLASGQERARIEHYFASSEGFVVFSPDSRILAGSASEGLTTLWDVASGRVLTTVRGNYRAIHGVAFSPDGERLISGGEDPIDVVRLMDPASGRYVANLSGKPDEYWFVEMSSDGNTLVAVGIRDTALLWHAPSWAEIKAVEKRDGLQP